MSCIWLINLYFVYFVSLHQRKLPVSGWSAGGADGDLGGSEGVGGPFAGVPVDPSSALRPTLGSHVDISPVQVGVSACIKPPAACI